MKPIWPLLFLLTACTPQVNLAPECPKVAVKNWSRDEQRQILDEERKLAPDSILIPVLMDYARLRREVR